MLHRSMSSMRSCCTLLPCILSFLFLTFTLCNILGSGGYVVTKMRNVQCTTYQLRAFLDDAFLLSQKTLNCMQRINPLFGTSNVLMMHRFQGFELNMVAIMMSDGVSLVERFGTYVSGWNGWKVVHFLWGTTRVP
uniref:Putative secreted peptide n=1 Tax=Anopheles braziliensis TaxID=58242 RepID=A0A2M3ZQB2_9DIPT